MKSGTVARIIDYGLMAVILLALVVPAAVTVYEEGTADIGVGIPSVYDRDELNSASLAQNIDIATGGQPGYRISYGNQCVDIVQSDIDAICEGVMHTPCDTVTILDPTGQVAKQDAIVYSNSVYMKQTIGFTAPGLDSLPVLMNMNLGLKDLDGDLVFKGNSQSESDEHGIYLTFYTPLLPYVAASAAGYSLTLTSTADMTGVFGMKMDVDMPQLEDIPYRTVSALGVNTITFDTGLAGNALGTLGSDDIVVSSGPAGLSVTYTGVLSERIDGMAEDGPVDITMGDRTYTMTQEDARGLAEIFRVLEAGQ